MDAEELAINQPDRYKGLPKQRQDNVCRWIHNNISIARRKCNETSYGLKHIFEHDKSHGGEYLTNGEFKGAMIACGFNPIEPEALNAIYRIKINKETLSMYYR